MNHQENKEREIEVIMTEFKCIDSGCDGNGCIPHQVSDDEWEAQQCQYCFEVRFPMKEKILASYDRIVAGAFKDTKPQDAPTDRSETPSDEAFRRGYNQCLKALSSRQDQYFKK